MGREVKRVPLDFDWPLNEIWGGYLMPDRLQGKRCPDCEGGTTHFGHWLANFTYVISMLAADVHDNRRGNKMHPWLAEFARAHGHFECRDRHPLSSEWKRAEDFPDEQRRAGLIHSTVSRFVLDRPSKDALDFFHGIIDRAYAIKRAKGDPNSEYDYDELYRADSVPPVERVGSGLGYSSSGTGGGNIQSALLEVLYDAAGVSSACPTCDGVGALEEFPGQKAERDAWSAIDHYEQDAPPVGEGWQLWETVSEGSPISPVFDCAEALATWMTGPGYAKWRYDELTYEGALKFVQAGWAPSFIGHDGVLEDGVTAVGSQGD